MGEIVRMVVVLSAITGLAGFVLSGLKVVTDPVIEEQILANVQSPALKDIFQQNTNDPIVDRSMTVPDSGTEVVVFPALRDGKLQGVAMEASGQGYGGEVKVLVGFDIEADKLVGISVTTHKETPGLGSRVEENSFTKQFKGRASEECLKENAGGVDAISGATLSSVAVAGAVKQAAAWYAALKDTIKTTW